MKEILKLDEQQEAIENMGRKKEKSREPMSLNSFPL